MNDELGWYRKNYSQLQKKVKVEDNIKNNIKREKGFNIYGGGDALKKSPTMAPDKRNKKSLVKAVEFPDEYSSNLRTDPDINQDPNDWGDSIHPN